MAKEVKTRFFRCPICHRIIDLYEESLVLITCENLPSYRKMVCQKCWAKCLKMMGNPKVPNEKIPCFNGEVK